MLARTISDTMQQLQASQILFRPPFPWSTFLAQWKEITEIQCFDTYG